MTDVEAGRRSLLHAALAFAGLPTQARELRVLHRWLDSWAGLGTVAVAMHWHGFDLQLTEYDERGWVGDVLT